MKKNFFVWSTFLFFLFNIQKISAFDATPPCFRDLENTFFDRQLLTEGLSYTQVQQGLWELIYQDLRLKTANIHKEVRKAARTMKKDPTEYPFNMNNAKALLQRILFKQLFETMSKYKYDFIRPSDIRRVFAFLQERHQKSWDLCR